MLLTQQTAGHIPEVQQYNNKSREPNTSLCICALRVEGLKPEPRGTLPEGLRGQRL